MPDHEFWQSFNEGSLDRRTFIKAASILGGAAIFGLPLLGCQPAASKQAFEVKVGLGNPLLQQAPIYSGDYRNIFVQEGTRNALTEFAGGGDQVRAVVTGGYGVAISSGAAGMSAFEQGEPARLIAGGYNASGVGFVVKADSPIKKPEDLKGKKFKIAYSRPNSASHMGAFLSLQAFGIDPNDKSLVEFVATGGTADTWTAVRGGLVDVAWSTEPTISNVEDKKEGRLLWGVWDLVKDWIDTVIMTSQGYIDSNANELKAWTTAYAKSVEWVKNNYSEASKDLAQVLQIEPAIAETAMKRVPKEIWSASIPKKSMEFMAKAAVEFKQLKVIPDWKVLVNQNFLPENLRDPSY